MTKVTPRLGLTARESDKYSIFNAIKSFIEGDWTNPSFNSFEKEIHNDLQQKSKKASNGILFPAQDLRVTRRDLSAAAFNSGGALVPTDLMSEDFISLLRNAALTVQMGVRFLPGLTGNIDIPKQTAANKPVWLGENHAIPESQLAFGQVHLKPTTLGTIQRYTRKLFLQSSVAIEQLIREDLAYSIALAIDAAILNGTGKNSEPLGILNNPNTNIVSIAIDGGRISYAALVSLQTALEAANTTFLGEFGWIMSPAVKGRLLLTPTSPSGVEGNFVLKEGASTLLGHRFGSTNQVPSNLGATSNLSAIILGAWNQVLIGEWGALEILPNTQGVTFNTGAVEVRALQDLDIAFRYDTAFSCIKDIVLK